MPNHQQNPNGLQGFIKLIYDLAREELGNWGGAVVSAPPTYVFRVPFTDQGAVSRKPPKLFGPVKP